MHDSDIAKCSQVARLINLALEEDIGSGDITTDAIISPEQMGSAIILAREPLKVAGLAVCGEVFNRVDRNIRYFACAKDGDFVEPGQKLAVVEGRVCSLLAAERTALNFLQRLCGIATHVDAFVSAMGSSKARLVDTRKTTPGWRVLEKYAVRVGGAFNHRFGLYDGVLIKDNHIAACESIAQAVEKARQRAHHLVKIEVEVENLTQMKQALEAGADVIMLDNMSGEQMKKAVEINAGKALLEVSGGVNLESIARLAEIGVDIISAGALTHSARSVDISMDIIS
ncbi:MAG: carboxylating nicotinate-nucleotide diphosphorylase [Desulfatibacillaceae bacterium]|nr:carboxylating nicotinate-nucleotide diphosphorylase [Desulfatibacillaceae bacterium]